MCGEAYAACSGSHDLQDCPERLADALDAAEVAGSEAAARLDRRSTRRSPATLRPSCDPTTTLVEPPQRFAPGDHVEPPDEATIG